MRKLAEQKLAVGAGIALGVAVTLGVLAVARQGGGGDKRRQPVTAGANPPRHVYTIRRGDVIRVPGAGTRCEASGEGGVPNLFCTRTSAGRYQVIFWKDSVDVYDLLDPRREPMVPTVSFNWVAWPVGFAGTHGVRTGASVATAERRWHVRLLLHSGGSPGCATASFRAGGVIGAAMFIDRRLRAAWFTSGVVVRGIRIGSPIPLVRRVFGARVRSLPNPYIRGRRYYYVASTQAPHTLLRFDPSPKGRVVSIGFGDRNVLVVEGCA